MTLKQFIVGVIVISIALHIVPAKADSVMCATNEQVYQDVLNLEPVHSGLIYQFFKDGKRYIVSTNNCIIEFDK